MFISFWETRGSDWTDRRSGRAINRRQRRSNKENRAGDVNYDVGAIQLLCSVIVDMRARVLLAAEAPITSKLKDRAMDARGYLTGDRDSSSLIIRPVILIVDSERNRRTGPLGRLDFQSRPAVPPSRGLARFLRRARSLPPSPLSDLKSSSEIN